MSSRKKTLTATESDLSRETGYTVDVKTLTRKTVTAYAFLLKKTKAESTTALRFARDSVTPTLSHKVIAAVRSSLVFYEERKKTANPWGRYRVTR